MEVLHCSLVTALLQPIIKKEIMATSATGRLSVAFFVK